MKKELVFGISLFCIITSAILNLDSIIVSASDDNHVAAVTAHIYGVEGYKEITVHLTNLQYQNLRRYLNYIETRLNQTTTREEALTLFKETISELDTYGLVPKGMTINKVLNIIGYERTRLMTQNLLQTKHVIHHTDINTSSNVINLLCLFYAHTWFAFEDNLWVLLGLIFDTISSIVDLKIFYLLGQLMFYNSIFKPFRFMNRIWIAGPGIGGYTYDYFTAGILGIRKGGNEFSIAYGFSGIKLILDDQLEAVYIGFTFLATK